MNLQKVILPPAISLLLMVIIIYGMGSCMSAVPEAYRVKGPWVVETSPEREITVIEAQSPPPLTISLFSWGALFSRDGQNIGILRYERVNYALRDSHNVLIWKMISYDTCVAVSDPRDNRLFSIERQKDRINFVDPEGKLLAFIVISGDNASLFSADDSLIASTITEPTGVELRTPEGSVLFRSDGTTSPAGLAAAALPPFDDLERAALMIMVK